MNKFRDSFLYGNEPFIKTFRSPNIYTSNLKVLRNTGIGGLGYCVSKQIVDNENIPVMFFNLGINGKSIFFERRDNNRFTTSNNYGKLLNLY